MTSTQFAALSPLLILASAAVVVTLVIGFRRNHLSASVLAALGLAGSFAATLIVAPESPSALTPLLVWDRYAVFFVGLLLAASFGVVMLSYGYLEDRDKACEEYYILLLLTTLGASVMACSSHFVSFFLGLEIMTLAFYAMIAYLCGDRKGIEAATKYLILSAVSDSFLLMGMALLYSQTGSMEFGRVGAAVSSMDPVFFWASTGLLVCGVGFKLSVVPFHMWTPDVYQGAPAPVTALLATVSKVAIFALVFRYFASADIHASKAMLTVITVIAAASMFAGNVLALLQNNVKRLLAYSSIAHMGYLLVALMAGGKTASTAAGFYLVAYTAMTLGAFGVVTFASTATREADSLEDFQGLAWRKPALTAAFTTMLLSLAGIPLTAGFIGKFYLVLAGIGSQLWVLVTSLLVTSLIGLFYYLRVVVAMFSRHEGPSESETVVPSSSKVAAAALMILTLLVLWFGVWPSYLIDAIEATVIRLG